MNRRRLVVMLVVVLAASGAQAQHHHHHHGHHHYGSLGGGFGSSTFIVGGSYAATPGFVAGVVTPYPVGIGALPYPVVTGYGGGGWYGPAYPAYGYTGLGYGTYGYGAGPFGSGYWLPPVTIPAETMYGPTAVRRMMGIDPPLGTPIVNNTTYVVPAAPGAGNANAGANNAAGANGFGVNAPQNALPGGNPGRPNVRVSNAPTLERARRQTETGDAAFRNQNYAEALGAYKDAARMAPDLADTYFRQAAAGVALSRYDDAVAAVKYGLRLSPTWVEGAFRFSALYDGNALAARAHLDALERRALDRPTSDLLFLAGVVRFFSDRPRESEPLFRQASMLAVGETWHIDLFLQAVAKLPPDAPQPVQAAKPAFDDLNPPVPQQGPQAAPPGKSGAPAVPGEREI